MNRAEALKAMALQSSDPELQLAAFEASYKRQSDADRLLQTRNDRDAVLTFLLGLPAGKAAPSAASIGEVLDIPANRVQAGLDSLTRDGRLLSDGTLDPRVRANQKPGQKPRPKPPVAPVRDTIAENRAVVQGMKGKMVDVKSLHGDALVKAMSDVSHHRAYLQDGMVVYGQSQLNETDTALRNAHETLNKAATMDPPLTPEEWRRIAVQRHELDALKAKINRLQTGR